MIEYLSAPGSVNMHDTWFEIATLEHFWIRRRFEVFQTLWNSRQCEGRIAEIGCGHGLVLQQMQEAFGVAIEGFDLNEAALKQANPGAGRLFYYNIHDRAASLQHAYDLIVLFDVIEHLEDDQEFIESILFHLKPGGRVIINVPAHQSLSSKYDEVVGHQRRYDIDMVRDLAQANQLVIEKWSYWGFAYIPILKLRKLLHAGLSGEEVTRRGFAPKNTLINNLLLLTGRLEFLPNHWTGTSLMLILKQVVETPSKNVGAVRDKVAAEQPR